MFFPSFLNFNMSPAFMAGNSLGASLGRCIFGQPWSGNSCWCSNPYTLSSMGYYNTPSQYYDYSYPTFDFSGSWNTNYDAGLNNYGYSNMSSFSNLFDAWKPENIFKMPQNWGGWYTQSSPSASKSSSGAKYASLSDYNAEKGKKLADYAYKHMDSQWGEGDCKKHVRIASENAGLGTIGGVDGVEALSSLRNNHNYKEVKAEDIDINNIPDGCIGIFKPGAYEYDKDHGHTEIYMKDPKGSSIIGVSSYITQNIKKADYYFIPV